MSAHIIVDYTEDKVLNLINKLLLLSNKISVTDFKDRFDDTISQVNINYFFRSINAYHPIYLTKEYIEMFGYSGELKVQKRLLKKLLTEKFLIEKNLEWFELDNDEYSKYYKSHKDAKKDSALIKLNGDEDENLKHIIFKPKMFKKLLMSTNTAKSNQYKDYYIQVETLSIEYERYSKEFDLKKSADKVDELIEILKRNEAKQDKERKQATIARKKAEFEYKKAETARKTAEINANKLLREITNSNYHIKILNTRISFMKNNIVNLIADKKSLFDMNDMFQTKLDVTTEKLEVTAEKLEVTSKKLNTTTEKLEVTSKTLDVTAEKLNTTTEKLEVTSKTLYVTAEKLEVATENIAKIIVDRAYVEGLTYGEKHSFVLLRRDDGEYTKNGIVKELFSYYIIRCETKTVNNIVLRHREKNIEPITVLVRYNFCPNPVSLWKAFRKSYTGRSYNVDGTRWFRLDSEETEDNFLAYLSNFTNKTTEI